MIKMFVFTCMLKGSGIQKLKTKVLGYKTNVRLKDQSLTLETVVGRAIAPQVHFAAVVEHLKAFASMLRLYGQR